MANIPILDGGSNAKYLAATGTGADNDPFVPTQAVTEANSGDILTQAQAIVAALGGTLSVDGIAALLYELQDKADLTDTQPVSLADLPDTSAGDLAAIRAALASVAVTGPLTDAQLRDSAVPVSVATLPGVILTRVAISKATGTKAASGDNELIAAPGVGNRLVLLSYKIQNESDTATTSILKDGATAFDRCLLQNTGDGWSWSAGDSYPLPLAENAALVLNLSAAKSHGYTVYYTTEAV